MPKEKFKNELEYLAFKDKPTTAQPLKYDFYSEKEFQNPAFKTSR